MIDPARASWRRVAWWAVTSATLAASVLLVVEAARYLSFDPYYAFLVERPLVTADRVWRACFYVHVAGGIACLATAPFLLWNGLANGSARLHRGAGRLHAVAALGWVGPTGFYLAPFAKGGLPAQTGFVLLATLFYGATLLGVRAIRRGDRRQHIAWMVRSYALLTSALSFRAVDPCLQGLGASGDASYVASTWTSLAVSIGLGEFVRRNLVFVPEAAAVLQEATP